MELLQKKTFIRKFIPWWAKYFHRLKIYGMQNLPKQGSAIIAPNHSGGWDYDNFVLMSLFDHFSSQNPTRRKIWLCYHDKWVYHPEWGKLVQQFSPIPLNLDGKGIPWDYVSSIVERGELIAIMGEGHSASIWEGYNLWKFYPGVIRLHLSYKIPIIPTAMMGFVYAAPISSSLYNPKIMPPWEKEIMWPPIFPVQLKVIFGTPIEFKEFFGTNPSKQEMYKLAAIVREKVKELIMRNL